MKSLAPVVCRRGGGVSVSGRRWSHAAAGKPRGVKSWVPSEGEKLEQAVATSLVHVLSQEHLVMAEKIVPWYLANFPVSYFTEVGEATRLEHLKGLTALQGINRNNVQDNISLSLVSKADDHNYSDVTVMCTDARAGVLHNMIKSMKAKDHGQTLQRVRAYSSEDGMVTLNTFTYGSSTQEPPSATPEDGANILSRLVGSAEAHGAEAHLYTESALVQFFGLCQPPFVRHTAHDRFCIYRRLYERVRGTEDVAGRIDICSDGNGAWISLADADVTPKLMLTKVTGLLAARGLNVMRMHLDMVRDPSNYTGDRLGSVSMIRVLVNPDVSKDAKSFPGSLDNLEAGPWKELMSDLLRIKWLDEVAVDLALQKGLSMQNAEILTAFCAMLHGPLSKLPFFAGGVKLQAIIMNPFYMTYATEVADLFVARFDPSKPLDAETVATRASALRERIAIITDEAARTLLLKMVDAVELTLRTNLFFRSRSGLALRVDPSLMVPPGQSMPFGIFFIHGRGFNGFHNRFQNIARGGLRLVTPSSPEQLSMELAHCYDEVYGLSHAQELKNKDIPEGGSKAVVLIDVTQASNGERYTSMRNSVKSFTNSLLDLTQSSEDRSKCMVDYLGFDELIYLGPDEQVVSEDINWIIKQAAKRGYPIPAAFMSSKPLAGINHKQYGVTSEGVVVFLDVALRERGIEPDKQPFTVKITGGPDGDVAGNLMRILFRDYGNNAHVVAVADGSGCAEDPDGLPHEELMRLFNAGLPISEFDPSKLGASGALHGVSTEEGVRMRNSMHNRVKADVFVPAGGRPHTIHEGNWELFLDPKTGLPSSPLIVEGANIFITHEARQNLFDRARVQVVKDSSANKCGVITSSFEICASMLIDEPEFLAIKEELVQDVLTRLRDLARLEAKLLFREYRNYPGALPHFSERISRSINRASTAIRLSLADMQRGDELYEKLMPLFLEHLPPKLAQVAGDRVSERIPVDYLRSAFASSLASKLLYNEGIHFLESQPEDRLPVLAMRYIEEEKRVQQLMNTVCEAGGLETQDGRKVIELLKRGGVRSSLRI